MPFPPLSPGPGSPKDATQAWPRPRRLDGQPSGTPVPGETRLDLADFSQNPIEAPTVTVKAIPAPVQRAARRERGITEPLAPSQAAQVAAVINQVLDEQAALNGAGSARLDAFLRRRTRRAEPTVQEVAAARQRAADERERQRHAHERHLERLEITRAYLGLFTLGLAALAVGLLAYVAFGFAAGFFAWGPVRIR